jgi:hypothetical protein
MVTQYVLVIDYHDGGQARNRKIKLKELKGTETGPEFLQIFQNYYGRHLTAKEHDDVKRTMEKY